MSEHAPEIAVNHTGIVIVRVCHETYRENPTSFIPNRFIIEHPVTKLSEHSAWSHDMSIQIGKCT